MTRTLLTAIFLTLFSQTASAETVFYCTETVSLNVNNHELTNYKPQNFKFRITERVVTFGSGGYFDNATKIITSYSNENNWASTDKYSMMWFNKGYFIFTSAFILTKQSAIITAKCDKF
ncbi:hypothetical protein N8Z70_02835 [Candidatus Puniceispirillum sp.]|nr:hypothetical protein [Alphaproteobacteria bacterium]MDC1293962.1 hypothetical protein [Candidatus Puniceispirillum sp.]